MFGVDKVVIMALDKRLSLWSDLEYKIRAIYTRPEIFLMGTPNDTSNVEEVSGYDYIDEVELPPRLPLSTNYNTWHIRPNAYNVWKAHNKLFTRCVAEGVRRLWLLEDDAGFRDNFDELSIIIGDIDKDWHTNIDMLYLGGFGDTSNFYKINPYMVKLDGYRPYGGFHSVILSHRAIRRLLMFDPIGPYDEISHRFLHAELNCAAVVPPIMCQRPAFSYVENQWIGREDQQ